MKRFLLFISIVLVGLTSVSSFAQVKERPQLKAQPQVKEKPFNLNPQNTVMLQGAQIAEVIGAENDKSKPPKSLIQNYKLVYKTTKGAKVTTTLQIEWNKKGEIVNAKIVNMPKGFSAPIMKPRCPTGCQFRCVKIIEFNPTREYYICVCIGGAHC